MNQHEQMYAVACFSVYMALTATAAQHPAELRVLLAQCLILLLTVDGMVKLLLCSELIQTFFQANEQPHITKADCYPLCNQAFFVVFEHLNGIHTYPW